MRRGRKTPSAWPLKPKKACEDRLPFIIIIANFKDSPKEGKIILDRGFYQLKHLNIFVFQLTNARRTCTIAMPTVCVRIQSDCSTAPVRPDLRGTALRVKTVRPPPPPPPIITMSSRLSAFYSLPQKSQTAA